MEAFLSWYSGRRAGRHMAPRRNRLASDAQNLVREWFRRQMPQMGLLTPANRRDLRPAALHSGNAA